MQYNQFPCSFLQELENDTEQKINQVIQRKDEVIHMLNTENDNTVQRLSSSKNKSTYGEFIGGGFIIGLVVGAFVCFTVGDAIDKKINFSDSFVSAILFWLMFGFIGAAIGLVLWGFVASVQKVSNRSLDNQIATAKKNTERRIADEIQKCEKAIQRIRYDANHQYQNYLNGFNAEVQKLSACFAESPLAVEVIDWMTNGYAKTIDLADRRSHIQEINIPFVFRTYRSKIECNLGTFDFVIKRCDELKTPAEQVALTRAIASAIQLNITMKYPQDASGTNVVTNIAYDYNNDNVMATIVYTAPNGNYRATRGWAVN